MTDTPDKIGLGKLLRDPETPFDAKKQMLTHLLQSDSIGATKLLEALLAPSTEPADEKTQELQAMIDALQEGPVRPGTFLRHSGDARFAGRVEVVLPDGSSVLAAAPEPEVTASLAAGDTVLLDAQARAVLARQAAPHRTGEEAKLVRRVAPETVEVELENQARHVFHAAGALVDALDSGEVEAGQDVIVCPQRRFAFAGVPPTDGLTQFRFVDRDPVPDVSIERDVASPKRFLEVLSEHLRREMTAAPLRREYRLHRCRTVFLSGVSGTGKTLSVLAFHRRMYEIMSERTGLPIDALPPRVVRLRGSQILSKWYGQAERNIDRLFDEVETLTRQTVRGADGHEYELPVLVIAEEIDGLTRARGTSHDAVDDRVQTTILQRLDTTARRLRDSLVVFLCTSNVPDLLDPAFVRRAGGMVEHFGRLDRAAFEQVAAKLLRGVPFAGSREEVIADLSAWLFDARENRGLVELTYAGSSRPVARRRREFLTGAVVERAIQRAADEACRLHEDGATQPGLDTEILARALAEQVQHIADQLTTHNAHHYLDVPRGARIAAVRPLAVREPILDDLARTA